MINNILNKPYNESNFGFFILRHVNDIESDKLCKYVMKK